MRYQAAPHPVVPPLYSVRPYAGPVTDLAALIAARQPVCGATKVVAIDGPSGAGKSVLADRLAAETGAHVLHLDEVLEGWHGLAAMPGRVARDALAPIAAGESGRLVRWSWVRDEPGPVLVCPPVPLLVLDGCGSGSRVIRPFLSLLVWVDGPEPLRRERAMARDGDAYEPWWDVWAAQERELFARERTAQAADVRLRAR